MNIAAALGACAAPLVIGGLTSTNAHTGWRNFYVSVKPYEIIKLSYKDSGYKWLSGAPRRSACSSATDHRNVTLA